MTSVLVLDRQLGVPQGDGLQTGIHLGQGERSRGILARLRRVRLVRDEDMATEMQENEAHVSFYIRSLDFILKT